MWGPVNPFEELRQEHPPLIGNRRQGPDLAEVGSRRSALWLKAHFFNPPEVSGASIMPSYAFLFRDRRGDDLVAYLESLRSSGAEQHLTSERLWHSSLSAFTQADARDGERLFNLHCATCHSAGGRTRLIWQARFKGFRPILQLAHSSICRLRVRLRIGEFVLRKSQSSAFPEPTCPDMNTCPTTKYPPFLSGCRNRSGN